MKTALITGATSGIGEATAFALADKGFQLILTGRRAERLNEVAKNVERKYGKKTLCLSFDIRNQETTANAISSLPKEWKDVDVLINNAGLAVGLNHIQDGVIDDWERMIDTNIKGLLYITRAIAPEMCAKGKGHIVNLGSIAGKDIYENGNVYCATKHAVDALSKAMRVDMLKYGIRVSNVCPGMVETEFSNVRFKGDEAKAKSVYKDFEPLKAEDIANIIAYIVTLPPHVCVNDILVMPAAQASGNYTYRKKE
jgi:NADP-dependent 3-hydroxy acid dehydrogenase YdfG